MGRIPRNNKSGWTTMQSSRLHALYINMMTPRGHDSSFDNAGRHINLYKARMPWKRSEFSPQIVPGYIHPVPERTKIRLDPAYLEIQPQDMNTRHLSNFPLDVMDPTKERLIDKMDHLYAHRTPWKMIRRPFLDYIYGEAGYVFKS